jgi:hypothetical protein
MIGTLLLLAAAAAGDPCRIEVVEQGTGWPVPLVELRTVNQIRFLTDNAGVIAFDQPEFMGRETWFDVHGHGYEAPKDGFGFQGFRLTPEPGKTLRVELRRTIVARRLGRLTGAGLYSESQKLGKELDWKESGIVGCDSVQNAVHRGKLFWAWGDTLVAKYPLGIFDMTSATTALQPLASFEPPLKLQLDYFRDEQGTPRGVAKMPGPGPTWVSGYVSLPDPSFVRDLHQGEAAPRGLSVRSLRLERRHLRLRAEAHTLDEVRRRAPTAAGAGGSSGVLERRGRQGLGLLRQSPAHPPLSRHL